jgi:hypothetical protein
MKVKEGRGSGAVVLSLALGGMGSVARAGDEMGLVALAVVSDGMGSVVPAGDEMGLVVLQLPSDGMVAVVSDGMGSVVPAGDEMGLVVLQLPSNGMVSIVLGLASTGIVSDGTWTFGVMGSRVLAVAVTAGLTPVLLFIERSVRDLFGRRRWQ